jgi:hypothetical protein
MFPLGMEEADNHNLICMQKVKDLLGEFGQKNSSKFSIVERITLCTCFQGLKCSTHFVKEAISKTGLLLVILISRSLKRDKF